MLIRLFFLHLTVTRGHKDPFPRAGQICECRVRKSDCFKRNCYGGLSHPNSSWCLLACLLATVLLLQGCTALKASSLKGLPELDLDKLGNRVLIIAPHPDDEGLATAGFIQIEIERGCDLKVVIITAGDGSLAACRDYFRGAVATLAEFRQVGEARCAESRAAMGSLGLPANKLIFLGYPDGSLNSLWDVNWDYHHLHLGSDGASRCPYGFVYQKNAPFCGENLVRNLESIIGRFKPSCIVYPDEEDIHHDHWAANAFTQYAITDLDCRVNELTYLVHRPDFPSPRMTLPSAGLLPPAALKRLNIKWETVSLSPRQETRKAACLDFYVIPRLVSKPPLGAFVRENELFGSDCERKLEHVGDAPPDFSKPGMPSVVILDAPANILPWSLPGADIRKISMCLGRQRALLGVEATGNISVEIVYTFRMRLFGESRVRRVDIRVERGVATTVLAGRESSAADRAIPVTVRRNRLWFAVPASIFSGMRTCMLSVYSSLGVRRVNKTAWRRVSL